MSNIRSRFRVILAGLLLLTPFVAVHGDDDLDARLASLAEQLDATRINENTPGMAIAIVKGDEIIFAQGFGKADLKRDIDMTPDALLCIGSSTKAFAATAVGIAVDEGLLDWDDPITKFIPTFTLQIDSDDPEAFVTVRDCFCHRTGFTRMGLLWASGNASTDEIFATAANAKPFAPFRQQWYYNNVTYAAGGVAGANAAGTTWDELISSRLTEPLGMAPLYMSVAEAKKNPLLSNGYTWNDETNQWKDVPMRALEQVGAAGAIITSVNQMTKWLRFQLANGVHDGTRLISEESIRETHTAQMSMGAPGIDYGLGWMLRDWNDHRLIEHGGNIDGFASTVAFLPDDGYGFVLLQNVSASPLQQSSVHMVFDALLGDRSPAGDAEIVAESGTARFAGNYLADFPPFNGEMIAVTEEDGVLSVELPGQGIFELDAANNNGERLLKGVPMTIAMSFDLDDKGNVQGMNLHQAGNKIFMPREGVEVAGEIPLDELQKYLGVYHSDDLDIDVEALIKNNRLAVDVPGQMAFELHPPNEDGRWVFRITDQVEVSFEVDDDGNVPSITMYQAGQEFTMNRIEVVADNTLPSVDDIMALRDTDGIIARLNELGAFRINSNLFVEQSGIRGNNVVTVGGIDRFSSYTDFGKFGFEHTSVWSGQAASNSTFAPFDRPAGKYYEQAAMGNPLVGLHDWRDAYDTVVVKRAGEIDGRAVWEVQCEKGDLPRTTMHVAQDNGDVVKIDSGILIGGMGITMPVEIWNKDFKIINGLCMPHTTIIENQASGRVITSLQAVEEVDDLDDEFFVLEGEEPETIDS